MGLLEQLHEPTGTGPCKGIHGGNMGPLLVDMAIGIQWDSMGFNGIQWDSMGIMVIYDDL